MFLRPLRRRSTCCQCTMWTRCWTKKCFMSTKKVGVAQKSISCRQKQDDSAPKKTKICSKKLLIFSGYYTILFQLILYSLYLRLYLVANLCCYLLISMIILIKKLAKDSIYYFSYYEFTTNFWCYSGRIILALQTVLLQ